MTDRPIFYNGDDVELGTLAQSLRLAASVVGHEQTPLLAILLEEAAALPECASLSARMLGACAVQVFAGMGAAGCDALRLRLNSRFPYSWEIWVTPAVTT